MNTRNASTLWGRAAIEKRAARDMVIDTDGSGSLQWNGAALPQGLRIFDGLWQSADRQVTYTLVTNAAADPNDPGAARHDLVVSFAGGTNRIVIRGWNQGSRNLGITFGGDFALPATTQNVVGDFPVPVTTQNFVGDFVVTNAQLRRRSTQSLRVPADISRTKLRSAAANDGAFAWAA